MEDGGRIRATAISPVMLWFLTTEEEEEDNDGGGGEEEGTIQKEAASWQFSFFLSFLSLSLPSLFFVSKLAVSFYFYVCFFFFFVSLSPSLSLFRLRRCCAQAIKQMKNNKTQNSTVNEILPSFSRFQLVGAYSFRFAHSRPSSVACSDLYQAGEKKRKDRERERKIVEVSEC